MSRDEWDRDSKTAETAPEDVELRGLPGPFDHMNTLPGFGVAACAGLPPRKRPPTPIHLEPLVPEGALPTEFLAETTDRIEDFTALARELDQNTEEAVIEAITRARCMGAMVEAIAARSGIAEAQTILDIALKKLGL